MGAAKIITFTLAAIFILLIAMIGANAILSALVFGLLSLTGIDLAKVFDGWLGLILIFAAVYFLPNLLPSNWLAWNRKYYIQGEALIDAPLPVVWDWMQIRERNDYFSTTTSKIEQVAGTENEFRMLLDNRLNDETGTVPDHIHVRVLDEEEHEYMAYHIVNVEKMPLFGKDHLMTEVLFEQQENGVHVRYIETLSRLTLTGFLMLLFLNPARDALKSLKAQIEGNEDTSIQYQMSDGMGENGEPPAAVKRAIHIGGITAMIAVTALAFGVMYLVVWLAGV